MSHRNVKKKIMKGRLQVCGRERVRFMRIKIEGTTFPTLTLSKLREGQKFYSELNASIAKSPNIGRRLLKEDELRGIAAPVIPTGIAGAWASAKQDWKATQKRKYAGESPSYVLYEAKEPSQTADGNEQIFPKVTLGSCFPGTIMQFNLGACMQAELEPENHTVLKEVYEDGTFGGELYAAKGSFLMAEMEQDSIHTGVGMDIFHTGDVAIKKYSGTDDTFQHFSGNGRVWLEVHGDVMEMKLYPGESVQMAPGYFLAMTKGVKLEVIEAGDLALRTQESCDFWVEFTAGSEGGTVWCHTVLPREFRRRVEKA